MAGVFADVASEAIGMSFVASPSRFRHVTFTAPTRGRLRSTHAVFTPIELPDELSLLPYDEETFLRSVFMQAGLDIRAYRLETLKRRIPSCLRALRTTSIDRARWLIRQKSEMLKSALSCLLIGVTGFFRDGEVFDSIARHLPSLSAAAARRGQGLRIWSAGCSEGPEIYSIAMILAELQLLEGSDLLGTDFRADALSMARSGCYGKEMILDVPPALLERYFVHQQNGRCAVESLRQAIRWRSGDLLTLIEPGKWDMILCRNVVMYWHPEIARRLLCALANALEPGGILVLGKAERPDPCDLVSLVQPCLFKRDRG
jgi:chemotaxis protein methyltransferase CheR